MKLEKWWEIHQERKKPPQIYSDGKKSGEKESDPVHKFPECAQGQCFERDKGLPSVCYRRIYAASTSGENTM